MHNYSPLQGTVLQITLIDTAIHVMDKFADFHVKKELVIII